MMRIIIIVITARRVECDVECGVSDHSLWQTPRATENSFLSFLVPASRTYRFVSVMIALQNAIAHITIDDLRQIRQSCRNVLCAVCVCVQHME